MEYPCQDFMKNKKYKEVKINDIEDLEAGDIVFFDNNRFGIVIKEGRTILHNHKYVKVIDQKMVKQKFYATNFYKKEVILRSLLR